MPKARWWLGTRGAAAGLTARSRSLLPVWVEKDCGGAVEQPLVDHRTKGVATPPSILDHKPAAAERQDAKGKVVVQARRALLLQGLGTSVGVWEKSTVEQQPSRIPVASQFVSY